MITHPVQQLATVGAIDPDAPQFLAPAAQARKQHPRAKGIRGRSGGYDHRQQQTQGIDQQMTLPALDLFATVVTAHARHCGRLDTLAIQTAGCRMLMPAGLVAHLCAQRVVDTLSGAVIPPDTEVMVDALPVRIVLGQHAPLRAADQNVQHRIQDLAHVQAARPPARFGGRDQVFDIIPVAVGQIGGVCLCIHTPMT
jgi:hypothetical protein